MILISCFRDIKCEASTYKYVDFLELINIFTLLFFENDASGLKHLITEFWNFRFLPDQNRADRKLYHLTFRKRFPQSISCILWETHRMTFVIVFPVRANWSDFLGTMTSFAGQPVQKSLQYALTNPNVIFTRGGFVLDQSPKWQNFQTSPFKSLELLTNLLFLEGIRKDWKCSRLQMEALN